MKDREPLLELLQEDVLKVLLIFYQRCSMKELNIESTMITVLTIWLQQGTILNLKDFLSALYRIIDKHIDTHSIGKSVILLLRLIREIQRYSSTSKLNTESLIEEKSLTDLVKHKKVRIDLY
jgi:hypothetical protein